MTANKRIEADLRKRASPAYSAAHARRSAPEGSGPVVRSQGIRLPRGGGVGGTCAGAVRSFLGGQ